MTWPASEGLAELAELTRFGKRYEVAPVSQQLYILLCELGAGSKTRQAHSNKGLQLGTSCTDEWITGLTGTWQAGPWFSTQQSAKRKKVNSPVTSEILDP